MPGPLCVPRTLPIATSLCSLKRLPIISIPLTWRPRSRVSIVLLSVLLGMAMRCGPGATTADIGVLRPALKCRLCEAMTLSSLLLVIIGMLETPCVCATVTILWTSALGSMATGLWTMLVLNPPIRCILVVRCLGGTPPRTTLTLLRRVTATVRCVLAMALTVVEMIGTPSVTLCVS